MEAEWAASQRFAFRVHKPVGERAAGGGEGRQAEPIRLAEPPPGATLNLRLTAACPRG